MGTGGWGFSRAELFSSKSAGAGTICSLHSRGLITVCGVNEGVCGEQEGRVNTWKKAPQLQPLTSPDSVAISPAAEAQGSEPWMGLWLDGSQCPFWSHCHPWHGGLRTQRREMAHFGPGKFLDKVT